MIDTRYWDEFFKAGDELVAEVENYLSAPDANDLDPELAALMAEADELMAEADAVLLEADTVLVLTAWVRAMAEAFGEEWDVAEGDPPI